MEFGSTMPQTRITYDRDGYIFKGQAEEMAGLIKHRLTRTNRSHDDYLGPHTMSKEEAERKCLLVDLSDEKGDTRKFVLKQIMIRQRELEVKWLSKALGAEKV